MAGRTNAGRGEGGEDQQQEGVEMADPAHVATDAKIKEIEKRLKKEYTQAAKETEQKLNEYWAAFQRKDEAKKQDVLDGTLKPDEYKRWRNGQLAMGQRWDDVKNEIAENYRNVGQIARSIANGYAPEVYAINHNYATYQVEHDGKLNTNYTLYDKQTVERIIRDDPDLLPPPGTRVKQDIADGKLIKWEQGQIQSVATQSIIQGESIPQMAKRIAETVSTRNYSDAVRYARTMSTSAQNAGRYDGYRRAKNLGVDLKIEWCATLDNRTRHDHRMLHGQRRDVDEPFEVPDAGIKILYPAQAGPGASDIPQREIWNCFVADTAIASDCDIVRSYEHEYNGDLISIRSATGVNFTCTPNHPILTPDGWVPAASLHEGDHLLITDIGKRSNILTNRNIYHVHPSIKALHDSFVSFGYSQRIPMSNFNFHGDIPTTDVEVVSKKRKLRFNRDASSFQSCCKSILKNADPLGFSKCHFMACFRRINISALRLMSSSRKALAFFSGCLRHSNIHGFRTVARCDSGIPKYSINNLPTMTNIRSELLDGLAGKVFVDNIVAVNRDTRGLLCHVYNLQTKNGYYFVGNNSISQTEGKSNNNYYAIAKNCRCTLLAWVKGFEGDTVTSSPKTGDLTFDEWQKARTMTKEEQDKWIQAGKPSLREWLKPKTTTDDLTERRRQRLAEKRQTSKEQTVTAEEAAQRTLQQTLESIHEEDQVRKGLHVVATDDIDWAERVQITANVDGDVQKAFADTIDRMSQKYESTLYTIRTATKEEAMLRSGSFAWCAPNMETMTTEMVINPVRSGNRETLIERLKQARQARHLINVPDDKLDQYVATHEFAHTILPMRQKLTASRNWTNADYGRINAAREEINQVYSDYLSAVEEVKRKRDDLGMRFINGDFSVAEEAKQAEQAYRDTFISNYSMENTDEFLAESVSFVELIGDGNQFANRVTKILTKYFGK